MIFLQEREARLSRIGKSPRHANADVTFMPFLICYSDWKVMAAVRAFRQAAVGLSGIAGACSVTMGWAADGLRSRRREVLDWGLESGTKRVVNQ